MKNDYSRLNFWVIKSELNYCYFIKVKNHWIPVSKQVYSLCRNSYRKMIRDAERDKDILYFEDIDQASIYSFNYQELDQVQKIYIKSLIHMLRDAISNLSSDEQKLLHEIYFNDKTEREVAILFNVPYSTLHNRKIRILRKLRVFLEQNSF